MKLLISCAISLLVALVCVRGDVTTPAPQKTCTDFLPAPTCSLFTNLIKKLNERASTLQDAINAAVQAHKTTVAGITDYVKNYIAKNLQCEQVISPDTCATLSLIAKRLHLTGQQLKMAIEKAVNEGKSNAKEIYDNVISTLKGEISCEQLFGNTTCDNINKGIDKFHEQRSLLREAIMSVAIKNYNNTKDAATLVKNYLVGKVTNFKCENVMTVALCKNLTAAANILKLAPGVVRNAIEEAVFNNGTTVQGIYDGAIKVLTPFINCEVVITQTSCENFIKAAKKFREQTILIKEALMQAALKHTKNAKDIYVSVKTKLIEGAKNFQCTDVLPEDTCNTLAKLDDNLQMRKEAVTAAVKEAIAEGRDNIDSIREFAKTLLIDEKSCNDFMGRFLCRGLRFVAGFRGISFDRVVKKMKELYANGVTKASDIYTKVKEFFGIGTYKRSIELEDPQNSIKDKIVEIALKLADKFATLNKKIKETIKNELKSLNDQGKLNLKNIRETVKNLLAQYGNKDEMDEDTMSKLGQRLLKLRKELRQRLNDLLQKMKDLINKLPAGESAEAKLKIEGMEKMVEEEIEKEMKKAIKSFL